MTNNKAPTEPQPIDPHLSEEAQAVFLILNAYILTDEWMSLQSVIYELLLLMNMRGVPASDKNELSSVLVNSLFELESAEYIGAYLDTDRGIWIRRSVGHVQHGLALPNKYEVVNRVIAAVGTDWRCLNNNTMLIVGSALRSAGLDWENRRQLASLFDGFANMGMVEVRREPQGLMCRPSKKLCALYDSDEAQKLRDIL